MNFKNGYKLIYEKVEQDSRKLYATKSPTPAITDKPIDLGLSAEDLSQVKLFYEEEGAIKASFSSLPTTNDRVLTLTIDGEEVIGDDTKPTPPAPTANNRVFDSEGNSLSTEFGRLAYIE